MKVTEMMSGSAALICATKNETLAKMAAMISHHNIGALPIVEESGALCGMVSERDIVRALAMDGHAALTLLASELMTRAIITCRPTMTFEMARRLMLKHGIRHLPVIDEDGTLQGIVSQRDLVAAMDRRERSDQAA